ncbi:MAG: ECF transporter S component [Oscillospiraceae bacterium]|nr:ECF transporter S component [Oscillospiraceae bacterium]
MKKKNLPLLLSGLVAFIIGIVLVVLSRSAAIGESAAVSDTLYFALSLILTFVGLILLIAALLPGQKSADVRTMVTAAMFAAMCYIGFAVLRIDIPVGTEKTAFHLGNVFCVLGALFLGGFWGGMAGAVGLTIADLTSSYITSAPKTFLLKLGIGLIAGLVAHKVFHISKNDQRKVPLPVATVLSCAAGMAFNVVADPLVGYFYKMYILGVPQEIASIWVKMGAVTTLVNAVIAVIVASVLYLALRPALKRTKLMPTL